jgi:DNA-directed RNA polymerase subunit RPC12/RpoP
VPCYRCGTRQADPEPGKSSPWRRGVIREHQVLVCPACQSAALADLTRCVRCGSAYLIRRLDQVECLDCRLIRDAAPDPVATPAPPAPPAPPAAPLPPAPAAHPAPESRAGSAPGAGSALAAEVARALERVLGSR